MRTALDVITAGSHGMFTRHNALASGHTDRDLRDWVQAGKARRLRRGVFALGPAPPHGSERLSEEARAVACRHGGHLALSHHAALAMHGIGLYDVPWGQVYAVRLSGGGGSGPGLRVVRPRMLPPTTTVDEVLTVAAEVAVVQVACTFGLRPGLVAADSALDRGLVSRKTLVAEAQRAGQVAGIGTARLVVARSCTGAESPGESLLRLIVEDLGYAVELQFPLVAEGAREPFAYADLRIAGARCLLEFDGAIKYGGANGREALIAEKTREDRIRRLGWQMERVVWGDLERPRVLKRRIAAAIGRQ